MRGLPPSKRSLWHDPAAHAADFAERYAPDLDLAAAQRMTELGIPDQQIGVADEDRGNAWAAFHPCGKVGGHNNASNGGLCVDCGVLNTELLRTDYGEKAAELFARSRLRDRLDAIIAHEYEEVRNGLSQTEALKHAPATDLPISERAREIFREMDKGWSRT